MPAPLGAIVNDPIFVHGRWGLVERSTVQLELALPKKVSSTSAEPITGIPMEIHTGGGGDVEGVNRKLGPK